MYPKPLSGVFFHWPGGLSSVSFYAPYERIRLWLREIFWLTGGVFSWLIAPWLFAAIQTHDLLDVLGSIPPQMLVLCFLLGVAWGFGGPTFGLAMPHSGHLLSGGGLGINDRD